MQLHIELTPKDFEYLTSMQMQWAGTDWKTKGNRFETMIDETEIDFTWGYAFWCDTYANYLLAISYLASVGQPWQGLFDNANNQNVILTDFEGSWDK